MQYCRCLSCQYFEFLGIVIVIDLHARSLSFFLFFFLSLLLYCSLVGIVLIFVLIKDLVELVIYRRQQLQFSIQSNLINVAARKIQAALGDAKKLEKIRSRTISTSAQELVTSVTSRVVPDFVHQISEKFPRFFKATMVLLTLTAYILASAAVLKATNATDPPSTLSDNVYFTVTSGLTIGYGDILPSEGSHWFMVFWLPLHVIFFAQMVYMFDNAVRAPLDSVEVATESNGEITIPRTLEMDAFLNVSEGTEITEAEFMRFMLVNAGVVPEALLDDMHTRFNEMNTFLGGSDDRMSTLNKRDMAVFASESKAVADDPHKENVELVPVSMRTSSANFDGDVTKKENVEV